MDTNESQEDSSSGREVRIGDLECVECVKAELVALQYYGALPGVNQDLWGDPFLILGQLQADSVRTRRRSKSEYITNQL